MKLSVLAAFVAANLLNIRFSIASHADRVKPKPSPSLI
jgi:hypothetical protein